MPKLTVLVRVRPLSDREITANSLNIVSVENGNTISITNIKVPEQNAGDSRERIKRFAFDCCFDSNSTQDDVYDYVGKEISSSVKMRFHSCILAYGQSASGKTHTMIGVENDVGLAPRLCENILTYLSDSAVGSEINKLNATISYLEIYNEKVRDLLDGGEPVLKVREHPKKGPYVQGLSEHTVLTADALLNHLQTGNNNRTVGATNANPRSSRSHSIFTITSYDGLKIRLVDLAGSERSGTRSPATSRFREGANINKSLVSLKNVISALAESGRLPRSLRKRYIPYRDSILTWLLKDTLDGNSKTILISTISPSSCCYNETVNTLRFGQTAKQILVQPLINEDPKERTIRELRAEIAKLREILGKALIEPIDHKIQSNAPLENYSCVKENEEIKNYEIPESINEEDQSRSVSVELIPIMDVSNSESSSKPRPLRRTFSMEQRNDSIHSSQESLVKGGRKQSLDKRPPVKKIEKPVSKNMGSMTELRGAGKPEVRSKIDSYRTAKPRSQIVAAVTQRLYNKVKKKDSSTNTEVATSSIVPPKELTICSNARSRLQELTHRALRAHRRKNVDTQTDLGPVLRVKEISTDVADLKLRLCEVSDVTIGTDAIATREESTNCSFLQSFNAANSNSAFFLTKSCGTSTDPEIENRRHISFTKYLQTKPTFEFLNAHTANPIFTSSVNINVNHNYITRNSDVISDDSLEEDCSARNICFPDLISNHNSLEPTKSMHELHHAALLSMPEELEMIDEFNSNTNHHVAKCRIVNACRKNVSVQISYAPQICQEGSEEDYEFFKPVTTHTVTLNDRTFENAPDSLKYYEKKKRVHFSNDDSDIIHMMSTFMQEANALIANLNRAANKLENFQLSEQNFDLEMTISDSNVFQKCKHKKRRNRHLENGTQTSPINMCDSSTEFELPANRYDELVLNSCDRLEEKLNDGLQSPEFSSLESNQAFSDYGSLPRRKFKREFLGCSPSNYLKQLTTMRKKIVKSTREELLNEAQLHI